MRDQSVRILCTSCRGGTTFTVTGQNLDVVQEPRLLLYVAGVVSQQQKRQADMPEEIEYRLEHGEVHMIVLCSTVGVKLKFPFGFRSTEPKRYTVLTKKQLQN